MKRAAGRVVWGEWALAFVLVLICTLFAAGLTAFVNTASAHSILAQPAPNSDFRIDRELRIGVGTNYDALSLGAFLRHRSLWSHDLRSSPHFNSNPPHPE